MSELLNSMFNGPQHINRDISQDETVKKSDEATNKTIRDMTDEQKWDMLNKVGKK